MSSAFHCLLFTWSSVYKQVHLSSKNWTFFLSTAPFDAKGWLIWKDPDVGKDWKQEEKGMTGDGCMASRTQWTWVWLSSGSWWWTGKPGVLQSTGSQRVRHNWVTELNRIWVILLERNGALLAHGSQVYKCLVTLNIKILATTSKQHKGWVLTPRKWLLMHLKN